MRTITIGLGGIVNMLFKNIRTFFFEDPKSIVLFMEIDLRLSGWNSVTVKFKDKPEQVIMDVPEITNQGIKINKMLKDIRETLKDDGNTSSTC